MKQKLKDTHLCQIIKILGITQMEAAELIGVKYPTLVSYINGCRKTPEEIYDALVSKWNEVGGSNLNKIISTQSYIKEMLR